MIGRPLRREETGRINPMDVLNSFFSGIQTHNELKNAILDNMKKKAESKYYDQDAEEKHKKSIADRSIKESQANYANQMAESKLAHQSALISGLNETNKWISPKAQVDIENTRSGTEGLNLGNQEKRIKLPFEKEKILEALNKSRIENKLEEAKLPYASELAKSEIESKKSLSQLRKSNELSKAYNALTQSEKNTVLATARSFGYDPTEASKLLLSGETLPDLAEKKGLGRNVQSWPTQQYAPTNSIITQMQKANVAQAGLRAIEPAITEWLAPYASTIKGHSPKAALEAITGGNKEAQAKAAAAGFLMYDANIQRLRSGGVNPGVRTLQHALETSMGDYKTFGPLRDPEVFKMTQKLISQKLTEMNQAENKAAFSFNSSGKKNASSKRLKYDISTGEII